MKRIMTITLCFIVIATSLFGQKSNTKDKSYEFGFGIGFLAEGEVYLSEPDVYVDVGSSVLFRAFIDAYITPKLAVGGYFNYAAPTVADVDTTMTEFGVTIKPRFTLTKEVLVKPGLYIGYRTYSADEATAEIEGLGLNLGVEFQYTAYDKFIPFVEIGFITQPAGGNEDTDATYGPTFYLLAGAAFLA